MVVKSPAFKGAQCHDSTLGRPSGAGTFWKSSKCLVISKGFGKRDTWRSMCRVKKIGAANVLRPLTCRLIDCFSNQTTYRSLKRNGDGAEI